MATTGVFAITPSAIGSLLTDAAILALSTPSVKKFM